MSDQKKYRHLPGVSIEDAGMLFSYGPSNEHAVRLERLAGRGTAKRDQRYRWHDMRTDQSGPWSRNLEAVERTGRAAGRRLSGEV